MAGLNEGMAGNIKVNRLIFFVGGADGSSGILSERIVMFNAQTQCSILRANRLIFFVGGADGSSGI